MDNLLDRALGLLSSTAERLGPTARWAASKRHLRLAPQSPSLIRGGSAAPELCMLPTDVTEQDVATLHATEKRIVQLKVDGIRALHIDGRIVSREGAPLDCALHCQPGLARLEAAFGQPMFFDSEYVEEEGFEATLSAHRRGEGSGVLWLFDAVPLEAWRRGEWHMPTDQRLSWLAEHIERAESPFVGLLNHWLMDAAETRAKARELWAFGYEGLVSKDASAGYVRRRSESWRRLKQTLTYDCPIVDVVIKDGRLKAVLVRSPAGQLRLGKGWDGATAERIVAAFTRTTEAPALVAEISYQLATGTKRSVRGAVFRRLRDDKGVTSCK